MRVHPTAYIHPDAIVHPTCDIGPHVVIEGPVRIGAHCHLGPSVVVMGNTDIGSDCEIHALNDGNKNNGTKHFAFVGFQEGLATR